MGHFYGSLARNSAAREWMSATQSSSGINWIRVKGRAEINPRSRYNCPLNRGLAPTLPVRGREGVARGVCATQNTCQILTMYCYYAGTSSTTLAQHSNSTGSAPRMCRGSSALENLHTSHLLPRYYPVQLPRTLSLHQKWNDWGFRPPFCT